MKKILYTTIVTGLVLLNGCTQPSNPPTPATPPPSGGGGGTTTTYTLTNIQGLWEYNADLVSSTVTGGGSAKTMSLKTGNGCKLDLTNTVYFSGPTQIQYQGYGLPNACNHPASFIYTYDQSAELLSSNFHVDKATNDSLILSWSAYSTIYYYSKNQLSLTNTSSINWNITLDSSYPNASEIGILIEYGGLSNPIKDTIPIVPGQLIYSGNKIVNTASSMPAINLKLVNLNYSAFGTYNVISLKTKLDVVGTDLTTGWSGTHSFCHSGSIQASCNGYDNIGIQTQSLSQVKWY